jgi:hypothetical protein
MSFILFKTIELRHFFHNNFVFNYIINYVINNKKETILDVSIYVQLLQDVFI